MRGKNVYGREVVYSHKSKEVTDTAPYTSEKTQQATRAEYEKDSLRVRRVGGTTATSRRSRWCVVIRVQFHIPAEIPH